jgi:hypothetical protein
MTFSPCVLQFPPISIKRGTEDAHSTVKQYDILNVKNAFIVVLLTLRGGTCLLSVCPDVCTVTTGRYDEERSCQHHRVTAVRTTE